MNSRISHESSTPVFLGVNETNGEKVAIKVIDIRNADKTLLKAKEMEADAMRKLRHPNIIYYYDTFSTVNNCYVVMELCEEGDLKTLLQKRGKLKLE